MGTSTRYSHSWPAFGLALILSSGGVQPIHADQATAAAPAATAPAAGEPPVPQESFLSSLKQAFKQDFDHQVVRGHFDVGSPPDTVHRYYCLVDAKTGKRQANGVAGETLHRADGMTGIKGTAVSLYSCASAEQQGLLVTSGYLLVGGAAREAAVAVAPPAPPTPAPTPAAPVPVPPMPAAGAPTAAAPAVVAAAPVTTPAAAGGAASRVDVAGVQLGMSLDEVRAVLRAKRLLDYHESTQTLGHGAAGGAHFVNTVAAWTPAVDGDAESYQVMFTPVPGRERAMAIIHAVAYSPAHALRADALAGGLVKKYGGYGAAAELPAAPTWRFQADGSVRVGDTCKRRQLFGGLGDLAAGGEDRPNVALRTTPEEFRQQLDLCGVAIVTEDHVVVNGASAHGTRDISRFTVTAYSPSIAFEGATTASQAMQGGVPAEPVDKVNASHPGDPATPNL